MRLREGHCLCGDIRFRTEGEPDWVKFCHCESCRRATSSPIAAFASFADAQVVFSGKVPTVYVSSPGVERGFCGHCGSPLFYRYAGLPGEIHLYPAAFVDDHDWQPTDHDFHEEHLPWLRCSDVLTTGD